MLLAAGCGGDDEPDDRRGQTSPPETPTSTQPPAPAPKERPLELGLMESNPALVNPAGPPRFAAARGMAAALRPRYVRVLVDWSKYQPAANAPPNFAIGVDGCSRGRRPCAPYAGLLELLRAIRARQQAAGGGWEIVLSIYGTPAWAARPAEGCERQETAPYGRMPDPGAYRALIGALQALGDQAGVALPWWGPWNEPNHPAFLNPQRDRCDRAAPSVSAARYAPLATIVREELRPGQNLVMGDLAGYDRPRPTASTVAEFIAGLPAELACAPGPWAQHTYVGRRGRNRPLAGDPAAAGNTKLIDAVQAALAAKGCGDKPIWVTETGSFDHDCGAMAAALRQWASDPRVDAAFQYTFREDETFPVGLMDAGLTAPRGAYRAWRAFADGAVPAGDPCATADRPRAAAAR